MTLSLHTDSDGTDFQIWAQRQANSCAIASMWMAESQARQRTPATGEWELAQRTYQHAVQGLDWLSTTSDSAGMTLSQSAHGTDQTSFGNMFANFGTYMSQIIKVMRAQGLTVRHTTRDGTAKALIPSRLSYSTPAIVLVGWYSTATVNSLQSANRRGGHFIVAAKKAGNNKIVYLDPWGGVLRERANDRRYQTNGYIEEIIYVNA